MLLWSLLQGKLVETSPCPLKRRWIYGCRMPDFTKLQFDVVAPDSTDGAVKVNFDIGLSSEFSLMTSLRLLFRSSGGQDYSVTIHRDNPSQNFVYSFELPSYAPEGKYTLINVEMTTNSGNYLIYEWNMFADHGLTNVANLSNPFADNSPPTLDSLAVSENYIDANGVINVGLAGHLTDNLSGVTDNVQVDISPVENGERAGPAYPTTYSFESGSFSAGFKFGKFQQSGWYHVRAVTSFDKAGNHGTGQEYLTGNPVTFYIDNPNQDITPPSISGFQIRAEYDETTNRPILVAEADVADAQSGLFQFAINMISPNPAISYNVGCDQVSGDNASGHYLGRTALPIDGVSGTFTLNLIRAIDSVHNFNEILGADAAAQGFTTAMNVYFPETLDSGVTTVTGSGQADYVFGSNLTNDTLNGGGGADYLYAGSGNDTVNAGSGNDLIVGGDGAGDDTYNGGTGVDTVKYTSARDGIVVDLAAGSATSLNGGDAAGIGTDKLTAVENVIAGYHDDLISGSAAANQLQGMTGNDVLRGAGGNDRLEGGAGSDVLVGGAGNDRLVGGTGSDTADYRDAAKGVKVSLALSGAQDTVGAGVDTISGIENLSGGAFADSLEGSSSANRLSGAAGSDTLRGMQGSDTLKGEAGNDKLVGGAGRDVMTGGIGADSFVFDDLDFGGRTTTSADRIVDFSRTEGDRIDLKLVDANPASVTDNAFTFIGTKAFSKVAGELRYVQSSGNTFVSGDTDGNGIADFMIRLDGLHTLVSTDFVL